MATQTVVSDTGHTFELRPTQIYGTALYSRRAKRSHLTKLFKSRQETGELSFDAYTNGARLYQGVKVYTTKSSDKVEIGCQTFSGENFKKLRRWALAKRK